MARRRLAEVVRMEYRPQYKAVSGALILTLSGVKYQGTEINPPRCSATRHPVAVAELAYVKNWAGLGSGHWYHKCASMMEEKQACHSFSG